MTEPEGSAHSPGAVVVWDPLVRIGRWVLCAAVAAALITQGEPELPPQGAGYVIAAYVAWRVVWGAMGPHNARFESFLTPEGGPHASGARLRGGLVRCGVRASAV